MKKTMIAVSVVALAAIAGESHAAADAPIKQVFTQLDRCLADNDAKCVGQLFAEDGSFLAPTSGDKIVKGRAQITKMLEDLMGAPAPNIKGVTKMHAVENVRMIGEDHAVVDASVGAKAKPGADKGGGAYHAVAIMALKGGQWLFEDMRSYTVSTGEAPAPAPDSAPAPTGTPGAAH